MIKKGNETGDLVPEVLLSPSLGSHLLRHRGRLLWVKRVRESTVDMSSGGMMEVLSFSYFGRDHAFLKSIIKEASELALEEEIGKTVVYVNSHGNWTKLGSPRSRRPMKSVILPSQVKQEILRDVQEFLENHQWYRDRGIPYRRGYLLHGRPGVGKSSFIMALAGELKMNICLVHLNSKDMSDDLLNHLLNHSPQRSIILLEDIDAAFAQRESEESAVTFSGLLNALDGVASQEGKILFMTTNHIERLDPALLRPGRIDVQKNFPLATKAQIKEMFQNFFPEAEGGLAEELAFTIPENYVTTAELQGLLLLFKNDPRGAVANAVGWLEAIARR